jgi:hypothetical protein
MPSTPSTQGHRLAAYPLAPDGGVTRWLACGPGLSPLPDLEAAIARDGSPFGPRGRAWISNAPDSLHLKAAVDRHLARRPALPEELARAAPGRPGPGGEPWRYAVTAEDSVIEFSRFNFTPTLMEAWILGWIHAPRAIRAAATLLTVGPAVWWVNGREAGADSAFGYVETRGLDHELDLDRGWNQILVYGRMIGWREARLALGLRLAGTGLRSGVRAPGREPRSWIAAESILGQVTLARPAIPTPGVELRLDPAAPKAIDLEVSAFLPRPEVPPLNQARAAPYHASTERVRLQPGGKALVAATPALAQAFERYPDQQSVLLRLAPEGDTRCTLEREVWTNPSSYSQTPYGEYDARRREALEHLALLNDQVLGALAAVEIGRARRIARPAVDLACTFLEERRDCADFYALSLLALLGQLETDGRLESALHPDDARRIERAFSGFKYWIDEPGLDAMCFHTENHQILFHVTAYLAGQRWPERFLRNSRRRGQDQRRRSLPRIREWISRRLAGGFSEWDSNSYLALDAFALLALVEFGRSHRLAARAEALLHRIFFVLACQSWRGVHGSTHGRCYVASLKTARVEGTSGLQRIAWGLGCFNDETRATGVLALARRYRVPRVLQRIGAHLPDLLVSRARSGGSYRPHFDLRSGTWEVNTLTRRTPDGMLSAALDHRPGATGIQEHLWQATLGPEAVVFTTHPGNAQEHENARPNFWAGSARLPRVAMHDRTVICIYNLALGGGLGFTHAYFPVHAFDEYALDGHWAFARAGPGYVALWGDGPLRLTTSGRQAWQELRSTGPGQVWLSRVGRRAEDGSFEEFRASLRRHPPKAEGLAVRWSDPGGEVLRFAWVGELEAGGRPVPQREFPAYENIYTLTPAGAPQMTIRHAGEELVLDLAGPGSGRRRGEG